MTSNAELIAFNDDQDQAILKYRNGKIFACPGDYIAVETEEAREVLKVRWPFQLKLFRIWFVKLELAVGSMTVSERFWYFQILCITAYLEPVYFFNEYNH